ncbi:MAG: hypothetical protein ACOYD0_11795 [Candidatus Nanopelagicales bacterium]
MEETNDPRDHLRLASSRGLSLIRGERKAGIPVESIGEDQSRPALTSIVVKVAGDWVVATATLALNGQVLHGSAEGIRSDRTSHVASATLDSISGLLSGTASVENAMVVDVNGREIALTIVRVESDGTTEMLVGSAIVRGDHEDATARSVLSALNRRLTR